MAKGTLRDSTQASSGAVTGEEQEIRAAAIQLESAADHEANLAAAERMVRAAAADGATLIVLPEKWPVLGSDEQTLAGAESLDGPAMALCASLAAELSVDLISGSFAERREGHERLGNTVAHFGPDGKRHAVYRKIHLFDADVGGRRYRESDIFQPGEGPVLTTLADGTVAGLVICFDIRFPALAANLAAAGARVICVSAAFTRETTEAHWESLISARAIETGCHVVAANQCGLDGIGQPTGGRSMIVAPNGSILAELGSEVPGIAAAEIDRSLTDQVREAMPLIELARPEAAQRPTEANL